ncbi:MAG: T9SS type A sorting domain-containing protein [Paludibacter sp.]|nr:T9SS type A sorting domain-containing protein [Paludibacter sp.]
MERSLFKTMLIFLVSMLGFSYASGQTFPIDKDAVQVYPENPGPNDSIFVAYGYVSGDACPDYYLEKDSIVDNKIFISKKQIQDKGRFCAMVITQFNAKLNIGILSNHTEIYFAERLIKVINYDQCRMSLRGQVVSNTVKSSIIQEEYSRDLYIINDATLNIGTQVRFHGTKIQCIKAPCYNIVDCYEVMETPVCVMNKKGIVVEGKNNCAGQLFIQEFSPISSAPQLFLIQSYDYTQPVEDSTVTITVDSIMPLVTNNIHSDSTITVIPGSRQLVPGDKVIFGGYYIINGTNDPNMFCKYVGIATCYELIEPAPQPECIMDKEGIVIAGKGNCANRLFVQELIPYDAVPRLYAIVDKGMISNKETYTSELNIGDKVTFSSIDIAKDSVATSPEMYNYFCPVAGVVNCYEVIEKAENFSLAGLATADTIVIQSGSVILFRKDFRKALNSVLLNSNGTFEFTGLPYGEYTVLVIPDINLYKKYLPTFYINKLRFKRADFVTLNEDIKDMTVQLRPYKRPYGNGKIYGNIFFESTQLKDTIIAENRTGRMSIQADGKIADNLSVILYNSNDEPIDWTVTDIYGNYVFENIAFDSYRVVSETAGAEAETNITLSNENAIINADLMLKSTEFNTDVNEIRTSGITVYPNPVTDHLTITLTEAQKVHIYNAMGQEVMHKQLQEGSNTLNTNMMEKGIYFIKAGSEKLKIVKK